MGRIVQTIKGRYYCNGGDKVLTVECVILEHSGAYWPLPAILEVDGELMRVRDDTEPSGTPLATLKEAVTVGQRWADDRVQYLMEQNVRAHVPDDVDLDPQLILNPWTPNYPN